MRRDASLNGGVAGSDPAQREPAEAAAPTPAPASRRRPRRTEGIPSGPSGVRHEERFALYDLAGVAAALGDARTGPVDGPEKGPGGGILDGAGQEHDTEQRARLRALLALGDAGRWRRLLGPRPDAVAALDALEARAPHMRELSGLVRVHLQAAMNIGMPITLPAILVVGPPGVGKSWYLSRLAAVMGVPFRPCALSSTSLAETIVGASPTWRNAGPGLPARMLVSEGVANGMLAIDEFDKAGSNPYSADPYRPFYALLDPSDARAFVDEYFQFPIDASRLSWVLTANDASLVPAPIADRLTVLHVPEMTESQREAVAASVYADANKARRGYFEAVLDSDVVGRLLDMSPRWIRAAVEGAMVVAAAEHRRRLRPEDLPGRRDRRRDAIGFRIAPSPIRRAP